MNGRPGSVSRPLRLLLSLFMAHKKIVVLLTVGLIWVLAFVLYRGHEDPREGRLAAVISANARKGPASFNVARKIAYVSRHIGTKTDFQYMANHLQLENVDYYDSSAYFGFQSSLEEYKSIIYDGTVEEICSKHDAVFISDSLADGWPFIMDGEQRCKNVVFVVTNRFDYGARKEDKELFAKDFNHSLNRDDEYRGKVIVNNLFEIPYMGEKGVDIPDYHPLIRPFGYNSVAMEALPKDDDDFSCLIIGRVTQDEVLMRDLVAEHTSHHCKVLPTHYGGPKTLSEYRSIVVHLPYQVSIMKMWENLAYGVQMVIPSPDFFTEICDKNTCNEMKDVMQTKTIYGEDEWFKYVDFYLPGWEKCFIQYSSWRELDAILTKKDYLKDLNFCRNKMEELRELNLQAWKGVLFGLQGNI